MNTFDLFLVKEEKVIFSSSKDNFEKKNLFSMNNNRFPENRLKYKKSVYIFINEKTCLWY